MLVFGLISPHPPIIIPAVGGDDTKKVQTTINALEQACAALAHTRPDQLIVISPHEGHGFEVPEYYLSKHLPAATGLKEILVTESSYRHYYEFGQQVGLQVGAESARYAVVASGDLSHVLKADGPYGFNAAGPVLDERIVAAVGAGDVEALLNLDPEVLENGAECGLRSILFLLGALENTVFRPQVLSYEGPFGVGYLVAICEPTGHRQGRP
jgi:AmmeMemoRadiSam system protein B